MECIVQRTRAEKEGMLKIMKNAIKEGTNDTLCLLEI